MRTQTIYIYLPLIMSPSMLRLINHLFISISYFCKRYFSILVLFVLTTLSLNKRVVWDQFLEIFLLIHYFLEKVTGNFKKKFSLK